MITAVSASAGEVSARRSKVVLPLPRKPVSTVVGKVSGSDILVNHRKAGNRFADPFTRRNLPQAPAHHRVNRC